MRSTTITARRRHLAQFAEWCDARGIVAPDEITPGVLERYRQWLYHVRQSDGAPLSWATQANKLTAVRMLLAWAARSKRITVNPAAELELPRLPKRLPRAVLSVSEMERVLAQPDVETALGLRDRAILEVLYSTGIRRMELIGLDCTDLDVERGTLFVREGKGKKDRVVPIGERAIRWTRALSRSRAAAFRRTRGAAIGAESLNHDTLSECAREHAQARRNSPIGCMSICERPASRSPGACTFSGTRWRR